MPELPEVETIKIGLEKNIIGLRLLKVELIAPKSFIGNPNRAEKKKVVGLFRRAKILGINLENDFTLLIHLKMTGQLVFNPKDQRLKTNDRFVGGHPTQDMRSEMPNRSTRVIFKFSDGSRLYFNDQRRFGWAKIVDGQNLKANSLLQKLGPEPLGKNFTWQILKERILRRKSLPVKVAIMDQEIVSGIGNIYAAEACFDAGLNPRKKVSELGDEEIKRLHKGIIKSLKDGIKHGGSSRVHFVNAEGQKGYFLDYAYVYGREKQNCKVCGSKLEKVKLGGRGTVFCPECQK